MKPPTENIIAWGATLLVLVTVFVEVTRFYNPRVVHPTVTTLVEEHHQLDYVSFHVMCPAGLVLRPNWHYYNNLDRWFNGTCEKGPAWASRVVVLNIKKDEDIFWIPGYSK